MGESLPPAGERSQGAKQETEGAKETNQKMTGYIYLQSEKPHYEGSQYYPGLWTVGFYDPDGKWNPESDHCSQKEAAERVHYLNGGYENE